MSKQSSRPQLFDVTLLKPHTHADVDYKPGDTIAVNEPDRDWLAEQQIINAPRAAKETQ